ncbi:very-long-chain 3-oxoacyl-CoA reductase-like [Tiliqua scincoides]|uniref:very-long-chain 3-oxoacyl-CoA reductase-like n=1 Tax=Tiliqua scincoides TaxID=71010 RepID=UPI003463236B
MDLGQLVLSASFVVVTGATAGIGKAYAHELAKRGLNVVLISRSLEKLKQVAAEIEEQHGRSTRVIQMDFTEGSESYEPIRDALQGLEIGILVNNVGTTIFQPLRFLDLPDIDKYIPDLVNCNILSTLKMTQIILPQMVARKKGIIINMSSLLARRPIPLQQIYAASKVFIDVFSRALDGEYRSKGIIVQSVLPGFVDTSITTKVVRYMKISADVFAHKAMDTVGLTNRTSGTLRHSITDMVVVSGLDAFKMELGRRMEEKFITGYKPRWEDCSKENSFVHHHGAIIILKVQ